MSVIDNRGRLFGRFNIVDVAALAVLAFLIPLGYGTYLLFRPATPRIDSVEPAEISRQERRLGVSGVITAKFKVKGTGFNPMLRAWIDDTQALAFSFENPNSADVLVGSVSPGAHDLILFDGVQEVARARGAIAVQIGEATSIRASGFLTNLDADLVKALTVGAAFPKPVPTFEILALGPLQPGRDRVHLAGSYVDRPVPGQQERAALLTLRCDPSRDDNPCALGNRPEGLRTPTVLSLPGPVRYFHFAVYELLPTTPARRARVTVRLIAETPAGLVRAGDKDHFLDTRAATVVQTGTTIVLDMGVDDSREGWLYRGQLIKPGAPFALTTDRYRVSGHVHSVTLTEDARAETP